MITIKLEGVDNVVSQFNALAAVTHRAVGSGLYDFVAGVGGEAVEEAPLGPTGNLRRSWFENEPEIVGNVISLLSGFSIEYAIYVHEMLENRHKIGKAKFYEDPMNRHLPDLADFLAGRLNEAYEGAVG